MLCVHEECGDASYSIESLVLPSFDFDQALVVVLYVDPFSVKHHRHRLWNSVSHGDQQGLVEAEVAPGRGCAG